jgi:hypothetical protein
VSACVCNRETHVMKCVCVCTEARAKHELLKNKLNITGMNLSELVEQTLTL